MKTKSTFPILYKLQCLSKCFMLFAFCLLLPVVVSFAQPVTLDPTFGENGMTVLPTLGEFYYFNYDATGNIIAIGTTTDTGYPIIIKTDANGILDENFGINGMKILEYEDRRITNFKITEDNKIFLIVSHNYNAILIQLTENGSFDESFGNNGIISYPLINLFIQTVNIEDSNFLLLCEQVHSYHSDFCVISKLNYNGEKDENFGDGGELYLTYGVKYNIFPKCIKILSDQSILLAGYNLLTTPYSSQIVFSKLDQNGQFVTNFANNGIFKMDLTFGTGKDEAIVNVLEDDNGNFVFIGYCIDNRFALRVLPNGIIDSTFGENGFYFSNMSEPRFYGNILLNEDKYLAGLHDRILSINQNGTLDASFNNTGMFSYDNFTFGGMKFQATEKLVLGGSFNGKFAIARLNIPDVSVNQNPYFDNLIVIYPNPTTGKLQIQGFKASKIQSVEVFDIYGKRQKAENKTQDVIDISNLQSGVYFVKIKIDTEEILKKIVKH